MQNRGSENAVYRSRFLVGRKFLKIKQYTVTYWLPTYKTFYRQPSLIQKKCPVGILCANGAFSNILTCKFKECWQGRGIFFLHSLPLRKELEGASFLFHLLKLDIFAFVVVDDFLFGRGLGGRGGTALCLLLRPVIRTARVDRAVWTTKAQELTDAMHQCYTYT